MKVMGGSFDFLLNVIFRESMKIMEGSVASYYELPMHKHNKDLSYIAPVLHLPSDKSHLEEN